MNPIFLSPTFWLGAGVALFATTTALFLNLYKGAVDELYQFRHEVEAAQKVVRNETDRKLAAAVATNNRLAADYGAAVDALRRRPAVRVLKGYCDSHPGTAVSTAPAVVDGKAEELRPDSTVVAADQCESRLNAAVDDALQVVYLQDWIKSQHEVTK